MTQDHTWKPDPTDPGVMLYEFESAVGRHSRNDIPVTRDAILKLIADLQAENTALKAALAKPSISEASDCEMCGGTGELKAQTIRDDRGEIVGCPACIERDADRMAEPFERVLKAHHDWQMANRPVEYGDSQLFHDTYTILGQGSASAPDRL